MRSRIINKESIIKRAVANGDNTSKTFGIIGERFNIQKEDHFISLEMSIGRKSSDRITYHPVLPEEKYQYSLRKNKFNSTNVT